MADYDEVFAIVTDGVLMGQQVYVCSTLDDGMCVCNIGQDDSGKTRYARIPKRHLRLVKALPMVRALAGQAAGPVDPGPAARPARDWSWIHPLLSRAV